MSFAGLYGMGRAAFLTGGIVNMTSIITTATAGAICASLVSIVGNGGSTSASPTPTAYAIGSNTDQFFSIIPGFATVNTGSVLAGAFAAPVVIGGTQSPGTKSATLGTFGITSPATIVFTSVVANALVAGGGSSTTIGALVLWQYNTTAANSPLICYIDTTGTTGLNGFGTAGGAGLAPNGSSITINIPISGNPAGLFQL